MRLGAQYNFMSFSLQEEGGWSVEGRGDGEGSMEGECRGEGECVGRIDG